MAKLEKRVLARNLRRKGLSLKEISHELNVSKSSVSVWCADVPLTELQIQALHEKMIRGSCPGRMLGARLQRERKLRKIEQAILDAKSSLPELSAKELLIAGLGLYWGEGSKKSSVRFCNSDADAARFMMRWFREVFCIEEERFRMYININRIHEGRLDDVVKHWSDVTNVPVEQFRKPTLIQAENQKVYENFSDHNGTLCVRIAKSGDLLYRILGLIRALHMAG